MHLRRPLGHVDDSEPAEKEDRRARVEDLQWDIALERKRRLLGRSLAVVVDEIHGSEAPCFELPVEEGEDPRGAWREKPIAFGRSEGFCHEIDGGLWFPADALAVGDVLDVIPVGCGPYDLMARIPDRALETNS